MPQPPAPPAGDEPPQDPAAIDPAHANVSPTTGDEPATPPDGWSPPSYEEWEKVQKAVGAANQRARKLEADAQRRADEEAAAQGQFKEVADRERARAESLEQGIKTSAIKAAIIETAQRMQFRNPTLAPRLVATDGLEASLGDDYTAAVDPNALHTIEERLRKALEDDPYLKGDPPRSQLPGAGDPSATSHGGNQAMNDMIRRGAGRA